MEVLDHFIDELHLWANAEPDVKAIALVGSHARGQAKSSSDIDLMIICEDPSRYLEQSNWLSRFGELKEVQREDWGLVQTWRAFYQDGREVEFNFTTEQWCSKSEIDSGTGRVISDGVRIIFDPASLLTVLLESLS